MKLVIGGAYQGKLTFAKGLENSGKDLIIVDGETCSAEQMGRADVVNHFHLFVRKSLESGLGQAQLLEIAENLQKVNPAVIVVSTELGYGVVPVDASDRMWRETTGRVCTQIAALSEAVYRVVCGIGMRIK